MNIVDYKSELSKELICDERWDKRKENIRCTLEYMSYIELSIKNQVE